MKVLLTKRKKGSSPFSCLRTLHFLSALLGIGLGFLFLLEGPSVARAQDLAPAYPRLLAALEAENKGKESPAKIWQSYRDFAQKGAWEESRNELEKLYQWKLNQGIRNHYSYAIALLRESEQLPKDAVEEIGPVLLGYTEKMAPDFSEVYYAQARWIWSRQSFALPQLARAAWYWVEGGVYSYANLEEAIPQYANLGYGLVFSLLLALSLYALSLAIRYYPFFHHHLRHFLNLDFHPLAQALLTGILLFLPFALGIGWLALFLSWLLVFWIYSTRGERTVSLALLVLVLFLPSAVRISSSFVSSLSEGGVPEIIRANNGVWSPDLHRQLLVLQQRQAEDPELLQAVSLVEKRMGKFNEAEQHLRRWIQLEGGSAAAHNNLGNVYLATNRVEQAMEAYQKAIRLDGARTESYYNLGQAYLLNLLLNEAESEFRRAKELRPQLITFYTSIASRHPNRMTIDRTLEPIRALEAALGGDPGAGKAGQRILGLLGSALPSPVRGDFRGGLSSPAGSDPLGGAPETLAPAVRALRPADLFAVQPFAGHRQPVSPMRPRLFQEPERGCAAVEGKTARGSPTSASRARALAVGFVSAPGSRPYPSRPCPRRIFVPLHRFVLSRQRPALGEVDSESFEFGSLFGPSRDGGDPLLLRGFLRMGSIPNGSNSEKGGEVLFSAGGIIIKMRA